MAAATTSEAVLRIREAGHVKRCHVVPYHGSYTVAEHSWQAAMLAYQLHPNPSHALIRYLLEHDIHERFLGDLPAPVKWFNKDLAEGYEKAAIKVDVLLNVGAAHGMQHDDLVWADSLDRLELLLWCFDQQNLGNRHIDTFVDALCQWFETNPVPPKVKDFINRFEWTRTLTSGILDGNQGI